MSFVVWRWRLTWKITFTLVQLFAVIGVWFIFTRQKPSPHVQESDFHPLPYRMIARCDRETNGEIYCPDIRRKGTTLLRRSQLVLTRLLRIFDLVAKKYAITYWLQKGTLLGSIRHMGHNPFDDDVDICIPKTEFEKFIKYGVSELPEDIFFQTIETDVHYVVTPGTRIYGNLRGKKSCYKTCLEIGCKRMDGLRIDIHVVEYDPDGKWFVQLYNYSRVLVNESDIFPLTELNFEGFLLPAPRSWKKILESFYGDFMTIPFDKPPGHITTDALRSCEEISRSWFDFLKEILGM